MTMTANGETIVWLFDSGTVSTNGEIGDWDEISSIIGSALGFRLVPFLLEEPEGYTPEPDQVSAGADLNQTVYLSRTGVRYHSVNNCGNMNPANAAPMIRGEARNRGHEACARCW